MRNTKEAIAWGRHQIDHPMWSWYRKCLMFARMCVDAPSGTLYAKDAYGNAPASMRRPFNGNWGAVRRGSIFIWTNSGAGHAVFCLGDGICLTNDYGGYGQITATPLAAVHNWCNAHPLGDIDWVNGVHFRKEQPPGPPPPVSLEDVVRAATRDPRRDKRSKRDSTAGAHASVIRVERALNARGILDDQYVDGTFGTKTKEAYRHFERQIDSPSKDGIPGEVSLNKLAGKHFRVVK